MTHLQANLHWHIQALDTRALFPTTIFPIWLLQLGTAGHYMLAAAKLCGFGFANGTTCSSRAFDAAVATFAKEGPGLSFEPNTLRRH
jgi:hypothetical protein